MLSVLRNEHSKAIIDPTLGEELLKLLLNGYVALILKNVVWYVVLLDRTIDKRERPSR